MSKNRFTFISGSTISFGRSYQLSGSNTNNNTPQLVNYGGQTYDFNNNFEDIVSSEERELLSSHSYKVPIHFSTKKVTAYDPYASIQTLTNLNPYVLHTIAGPKVNKSEVAYISGELIVHIEPTEDGNILNPPGNNSNLAYDLIYTMHVSGHKYRRKFTFSGNGETFNEAYNHPNILKCSVKNVRPILRETFSANSPEFDVRIQGSDNPYGVVGGSSYNLLTLGPLSPTLEVTNVMFIRIAPPLGIAAQVTGDGFTLNDLLLTYRNDGMHHLIEAGTGEIDPSDELFFQGNDNGITDSPEAHVTIMGELTVVWG